MEQIIEKSKCCGCHACMNICPKHAISMYEDEKGFKYPKIDQDKCINCGMCKKVCPIINSKEIEKDIKAYACYNINNDERLNSSSGGIFILLAKEIIKRKGIVFGASFDKDFNVNHSYADNEKDLNKFMGSKYTQSTIGETYKQVKDFLENDRYVLFSGTPCQIEGLKSYLRKDYEKLYTQDIICHGVPSPRVWKIYLDFLKNQEKEKIRNVHFRNKDHGWSLFRMKVLFDTKTYSKSHQEDLFMKAFLSNLCLRDSCYNCSFKKKYRISDITLADYWGINNIHPDMYDDKGTSLVIINSDKGKELFELIKDGLKYVDTNLNEAIKYNPAMIKSVDQCKNENEFFNHLEDMAFDELVYKYIPRPTLYRRIVNKTKRIIKRIIKK